MRSREACKAYDVFSACSQEENRCELIAVLGVCSGRCVLVLFVTCSSVSVECPEYAAFADTLCELIEVLSVCVLVDVCWCCSSVVQVYDVVSWRM